MIGREFLWNYLNQTAWKMNLRYFGKKLFDRLVVTAIFDVLYASNKEWSDFESFNAIGLSAGYLALIVRIVDWQV